MVIRIPKWVLLAIGAIALLGAGLAIGVLVSGHGDSRDRGPGVASTPPCNQSTAKAAIADSTLAEELAPPGSSPEGPFAFYAPELVACKDLTGDDRPEMIAQLIGQTASATRPWAIFEARSGGWNLVMSRRHLQSELRLRGDRIEESIPAYADGDPGCCPSGERSGTVSWNGRTFTYSADSGTKARRIEIAPPAGARSIAGLVPATATEPDAVQVFGVPSYVSSFENSCNARWTDIGLEMVFADLGGGDPCSREGSFVAAIFSGTEAEQAGWQVGGLHIGSSVEEMLMLYPEAAVGDRHYYQALNEAEYGTPFVLTSRDSPLGYEGRLPTFAAIASRGAIIALDLHSGAAGD